MLILATVIAFLLWVLGGVWIEWEKTTTKAFLLSAGLLIAASCLLLALARIVELLEAIRSELVMIRTHIDRELLDDIATDLAAMRTQMGRGVLGLLGI